MMKRWICVPVLAALLALPAAQSGAVFAAGDEDLVPAFNPPEKLDTSPVELPEITKRIYKNGLTVYYVPHHELPVVSMRLIALTGSLYNPMDKPGLTGFMADLLTKGTEKRTAPEIADAIDFVGGSLNSGAGWNGTYVQVSVLKRDFELGLDLLSDVSLHPTFPEEEIERTRRQWIAGLMQAKDNPGTIAGQAFDRFVYGDHPFAFPVDGTVESVQGFTRADLVAQHERLFVPGNVVLAVAGDITPKAADKLVRRAFGKWPKGERPVPAAGDPVASKGGEILLVDKPDAVQSEIRMGYVLGRYNMGDDFFAFKLMNYMVGGGGFNSRLMLRLRNELGLTYSLRSGLSPRQQAGAYTISSFTKTETTGEMIKEIYAVLDTILAEGFTAEELKDAKSYLIGSYPMNFETPAQIATQFQTLLLYDFGDPAKHIASYRQKIAEVTLEDVNRLAKKYLHPDRIRIAVVGVGDEVEDQLKPFGSVERISIEEF